MGFITTLLLAISCSIDAFGIGITYGFRNIKLSKSITLILFVILFIVTISACLIGNIFKFIFPENIAKIIGSAILIIIGLVILFKPDKDEVTFDFDNSNNIDYKEATALAFAISIDSFCIGIGISAMGVNILLFSFLSAILHCIFLNCSLFLGSYLTKFTKIPQRIWAEISGELLIFIGIFKLFF